MKRLEIRPATVGDLVAFYGQQPAHTVKALAVVKAGTVIGVGGLERQKGFYVAFSDLSDEIRNHKKAILKAGKLVVEMIKASRLPVVAIRNTEEKTSNDFLVHLGFIPSDEPEIYVWSK